MNLAIAMSVLLFTAQVSILASVISASRKRAVIRLFREIAHTVSWLVVCQISALCAFGTLSNERSELVGIVVLFGFGLVWMYYLRYGEAVGDGLLEGLKYHVLSGITTFYSLAQLFAFVYYYGRSAPHLDELLTELVCIFGPSVGLFLWVRWMSYRDKQAG